MGLPADTPLWTFEHFFEMWLRAHNSNDAEYNTNMMRTLRRDPHFRSQLDLCDLRQLLPRFNFVADFANISHVIRPLMERTKTWDEFGRTGW